MKKNITFLCIVMLTLLFTACGNDYKVPDEDSIGTYLNKRYDKKFELVSQKETKIDGEKITIYEYEDEDGIEFHVSQLNSSDLFGSHYRIVDDYMVQWLFDNEKYYEDLEDSDFKCEKFDTITESLTPMGGFILHVDSFEELEEAITISNEVATNKNCDIPDKKYKYNEIDAAAIYPSIVIYGPDLYDINRMSPIHFATEVNDNIIDTDDLIKKYDYVYVDAVRSGAIDEKLSDKVLKKYGPRYIENVSFEGKALDIKFNRDNGYTNLINRDKNDDEQVYYFYEQCHESGSDLVFDEVADLAGYADFEEIDDYDSDLYTLSDGKTTVVFSRKEDELYVEKNGKEFKLQGSIMSINGNTQIVLTTDDLEELFGFDIDVDTIDEEIEMSK